MATCRVFIVPARCRTVYAARRYTRAVSLPRRFSYSGILSVPEQRAKSCDDTRWRHCRGPARPGSPRMTRCRRNTGTPYASTAQMMGTRRGPIGLPLYHLGGDIATVHPSVMPVYTMVTANGKPAVLLNIFRQPDSNTVAVSNAADSEL